MDSGALRKIGLRVVMEFPNNELMFLRPTFEAVLDGELVKAKVAVMEWYDTKQREDDELDVREQFREVAKGDDSVEGEVWDEYRPSRTLGGGEHRGE